MTQPPGTERREWWTRPATILPLILAVTIFVALLTPEASQGRFGDSRLSSHFAGSLGARVLADVAHKLGWQVVQRDSGAVPIGTPGSTIHALLAPVLPVTREQAHAYLEAVRKGDALLLALKDDDPLSDSLHVTHYSRGSFLQTATDSVTASCGKGTEFTPALWADNKVHLWGVRWLRDAPSGQVTFAPLAADGAVLPPPGFAAIGFPYGVGRIVIVSDGDLLRNDVMRYCPWGADVIDVAILEWLRAGGEHARTTLSFDEYHQGFGPHPGMMGQSAAFLADHPVGRTILQCIAASLLLLLALAPRPLPPQHVDRVERRDPLEQVDALAHAYQQVRGTRTVVARLVRGLRWRVDRGTAFGVRPDDQFLDWIETVRPALTGDLALVRRGLTDTIPDDDLVRVGDAIRRIELTLTTRLS